YQFAPVWQAQDLERIGAVFLVVRRKGRIAACMSVWDQSAVKQTRVCGYARPIQWARPLINLFAPLIGTPKLPHAGSILKQVYLSHIAVRDLTQDDFVALFRAALSHAHQCGSELAVAGLSARHPFIETVRQHWKCREYRSLLHVVHWPE